MAESPITVTRELFFERARPAAGLATPTRLFTSPARGYARTSKIVIGNSGAATTFNIWIGNQVDTETATTLILPGAAIGAGGSTTFPSFISLPGGDALVNGGWISVSSTSGNVSFHVHGTKVTITT